jgi:hypothetical protein
VTQAPHPNTPSGFSALGRYWTLTETDDVTAVLTFNYLQSDVGLTSESSFQLKRWDGSIFQTIPAVLDVNANTVTTTSAITEFSDWTLLSPLAPTAAGAAVGGRILTSDGLGVPNASVTLTSRTGVTRTAISNPFGYYLFVDVTVGETYTMEVRSKRYEFAPRLVTVVDDLADVDFIAQ